MSIKHIEHDRFHGHKGCGCQRSMLSQLIRELKGVDPSRREFLKSAGARWAGCWCSAACWGMPGR
jgi:hypothetical protein